MKFFHGVVACLLLASAALAQGPVRYRYWKPIERPAAKEEEIVAFTIDSDIYAATRPGLPDLRILDEEQTEAPFQLEAEVEYREERSREPFGTEIVSLKPEGNSLEIRLRLSDKTSDADGFTLATPLTNYERKVRVFGSADGGQWTPLVTDGIIFDYSRYMDVSNREIALAKNSFRMFRIVIEDVTDEKESPFKELTRTLRGDREDQRVERTMLERRPFRIDRINAWHAVTRERVQKAKTAVYPIAGFEAKDDAAKKETILSVRTRRAPIARFTLETPSRNFSRRAVVETPVVHGVNTEWHPLGEATISNFSFRNQRREELAINFPERREEQFRIVIRNEDNPPLKVAGVTAEGSVQRAIFLAQPGKSYRIYYGSETATAPKYEAAAVLTNLQKDFTPVQAKLGAQTENTGFNEGVGPSMRGLLNNWFFLGTAIALMVAGLAWTLYRAGRRLEGLPKE